MDREELQELEREYRQVPVAFRGDELKKINLARLVFGMASVSHAELMGEKPTAETTVAKTAKKPKRDLSRAVRLHAEYLAKLETMKPHREYADRVARATMDGRTGQTPVKPMATMGCGGGALLCDHCGKPMTLEGGKFHAKPADVAWANNPERENGWVSWILGGMVVDVETNGTVRVYHGHVSYGAPNECSKLGKAAIEKREAEFKSGRPDGILDDLEEYLKKSKPELNDRERLRLVSDIVNELYAFDPGVGVNRPD